MKIPKLNIETSEIQKWVKPYSEIKAPKGWRLISLREIIWIIESKYKEKFLGKCADKYNLFWCKQLKEDKNNNYSRWFDLDRYWYSYSYWDGFDNSNAYGRVVFVRKLK